LRQGRVIVVRRIVIGRIVIVDCVIVIKRIVIARIVILDGVIVIGYVGIIVIIVIVAANETNAETKQHAQRQHQRFRPEAHHRSLLIFFIQVRSYTSDGRKPSPADKVFVDNRVE